MTTQTETKEKESLSPAQITRKVFLKQVLMATGFALVSCSPLKVALNIVPERFKGNPALCEEMLRSFVTTIIPAASPDEADLVRIFHDEYYPFYKHCQFFAADLSKKSKDLWGDDQFQALSLKQRSRVVEEGLRGDATVQRLYRAAILMTQVSWYGGIYDDDRGCDTIKFPGANWGFTDEEMYYPNVLGDLAHGTTLDGNYS